MDVTYSSAGIFFLTKTPPVICWHHWSYMSKCFITRHKQTQGGCKTRCCTFSDTVSQALLRRTSCVTTSGLMWFFCGCNCSSSQSEHWASKTALMITRSPSLTDSAVTLQKNKARCRLTSGTKTPERDDSRPGIPIKEISDLRFPWMNPRATRKGLGSD